MSAEAGGGSRRAGDDMDEFVSESIRPIEGTADAAAMASGLPGLPRGFEWRGQQYEVVEQLAAWKWSSRAGGSAKGQLYLRRHYFRLRMSDQSVWKIYFVRQSPRGGSSRRRWYMLERSDGA